MHPTRRLRNNFLAAKIRKLHGGGSPVGWGKERTPTSTTLTPTITDRISLTRTIRRNNTAPNISMRSRARPIGGATDVSVFHWVVTDVIDVAGQIIVIAYRMLPIPLPIPALPTAALAFRLATFRDSFVLGQTPRKSCVDARPSGSTTMATIS